MIRADRNYLGYLYKIKDQILILTDFLMAHCLDGLENNLSSGQNNMMMVWCAVLKSYKNTRFSWEINNVL